MFSDNPPLKPIHGYGSHKNIQFKTLKEGNLYFVEEKEVDLTSTSLDLQVPTTAGKCSVKGQLWKYDVEWNCSSVMSPSLFKHPLMLDLKNILYKLSSKTEHTQLLIIRWLINLQISKFSYGIQALKLFCIMLVKCFLLIITKTPIIDIIITSVVYFISQHPGWHWKEQAKEVVQLELQVNLQLISIPQSLLCFISHCCPLKSQWKTLLSKVH